MYAFFPGFRGFKTRSNKRQRVGRVFTGEITSHLSPPEHRIDAPPAPSFAPPPVVRAASPADSLASYESDSEALPAPAVPTAPVAPVEAPSTVDPPVRPHPSLFATPITFADYNARFDPLSAPIKYAAPTFDADTTFASTASGIEGPSHPTNGSVSYNDLESHQYQSIDELKKATDSLEHHAFYWEDGDVIIHCGTVIFRVHAEVLVEHSWMYREMLGEDGVATMMSEQRELPGVKVYIHDEGVAGETVEDYEFMLMSFYRP